MPEPVLSVGTLDIATFDEGRGAKLRMVRNTTVKKEVATYFALKGMTVDSFMAQGMTELGKLRAIARALRGDGESA